MTKTMLNQINWIQGPYKKNCPECRRDERRTKLDLMDKLTIAVAISFFALASAYCLTMQFTEAIMKGF
jgi:hypothetical protein